jgi:hypothetical protein
VRVSQEFDQCADDVQDFLEALRQLRQAVGPLPQWGFGGSVLDGIADPGVRAMIDNVTEKSGAAHKAVIRSGFIQVFGGRPFDPVADWQHSFIPGHPNTANLVDSHCVQIIGYYREAARTAREREKGIAGLLARFVRFPSSVREAAGLQSRAGQQSAFIVAIIAQVMATLIAAGVLGLVGYLIAHRLV